MISDSVSNINHECVSVQMGLGICIRSSRGAHIKYLVRCRKM